MALTKEDLLEVGKLIDQRVGKLIDQRVGKIIDQRLDQRLDWNVFKKLIRLEVDEALEEKLAEKLKYLPTKDEFYKTMDKIMKEIEAMRQELTLTPSHTDLATLEERIEPLERLHPGGKHVALISV